MPGVSGSSGIVRSWFQNAELQRFKPNSFNENDTTITWDVRRSQAAVVYDRLSSLQVNGGLLFGRGVYLDEYPNAPRGHTRITVSDVPRDVMSEYRARELQVGIGAARF